MFISDDRALGEGFDHVLSCLGWGWDLHVCQKLSDTFWCALWLQEEANDALQHIEAPIATMAHNYNDYHLLLHSQMSKFYILLRQCAYYVDQSSIK